MVKLLDRVKMTVSGTPGTGNITLNAAEAGFQTFAQAGAVDTNVVRYAVTDGTNFEIGTAVLSSSATVLTRTVQQSSNSNNALDLTSSAVVFATLSAADLSANPAPRWTTEPASTLNLANDGSTAVTLTGVAVDENFPVRYSWDGYSGATIYDADSLPPQLASAPVINQSTGVTTLVGSSTSSNAGTYYHRTKATDGINTTTQTTGVQLAFGYNITSASYDNASFSVWSQEGGPTSLAFSSDGTKMFIVGFSGNTFHQYSLTTGFSLASGNVTYDNVSFSSASQESNPRALAFNSDGTKMFVIGTASDAVYQYSLTTGFSLASGNVSYDNASFSVASQEGSPLGLAFNHDGTKMFVTGTASGAVYQYSLTTGFSLASGNVSYDNASFSVTSQESSPSGLAFNHDGTKMLVIGRNANTVHQYSLTTGFSLASGNVSYDNASFSVASQETSSRALAFSSDGTKMFVIGAGSSAVYQYSTAV